MVRVSVKCRVFSVLSSPEVETFQVPVKSHLYKVQAKDLDIKVLFGEATTNFKKITIRKTSQSVRVQQHSSKVIFCPFFPDNVTFRSLNIEQSTGNTTCACKPRSSSWKSDFSTEATRPYQPQSQRQNVRRPSKQVLKLEKSWTNQRTFCLWATDSLMEDRWRLQQQKKLFHFPPPKV